MVMESDDAVANAPQPAREGMAVEQDIYTQRFSAENDRVRRETWRVLCRDYFQHLVPRSAVLVDLGAGDGLFIRHMDARVRVAVDLSPHVLANPEPGVVVIQAPGTRFASLLPEPADVIFMSNFLEHMPTRQVVLAVLDECRRALKPTGRVIILQPNVRYAGAAYWDYIDHHVALTEHSLGEALQLSGFTITKLIPRFLPFTAKSPLGALARLSPGLMTRAYLAVPFAWRFLGAQTLAVAQRGT